MPIIYKRSESPEFDLSDPKYRSASSSKHDVALELDELDLLPPVAVVSPGVNAKTQNDHQRQMASSSSSAPRSAKRNSSQAPPPKRLRVEEEQISHDHASTSTSRRPINASEHHPSSDNLRRQATQPRPSSQAPPPPPPKTTTTSRKRTQSASAPSPFPRQVRSDEPPFGKQQHGAPTRPQPGMPTPSTSSPPREFPGQRTVKQPSQTSRQQPRPRSSPSVERAPVVQDLSCPDHPLRTRRAIYPPDREMKLPIEPSNARQDRQDLQSITFMKQAIAQASAPPSVDEVFPPRRGVERQARPATDGSPTSDKEGTTQQPRRNPKPAPRTSNEIEGSAPGPQRNERSMRPASVRKAQERRTKAVVVSEDRPAHPQPVRSLPRDQPQDDPIEQCGYPCRRTDPAPLPRRSFDTQPPPPPPRPPPQPQSPAPPPPRLSNPSPKPLPKLHFPNVETFLANLPLPLAHLTPTVAGFGCSSQADLLALSARTEGGAKARRAMMDELERRGDLTPWQRIVVEAELEVLGERAAGR